MDHIDYDRIAEFYDLYASTDYDHAFFLERIKPGSKLLELTSGTGRLSLPLARVGARLTCVDISQAMLARLAEKLAAESLSAEILCADIGQLHFDAEFDMAILPFQSFMELTGREKQLNALYAIHKALRPGGIFYCTMHNPAIRKKSVDGIVRAVGTFQTEDGYLVVSGFETAGNPVVRRSQFLDFYDAGGHWLRRQLLPMEFELIGQESFEAMATLAGFQVSGLFGDYRATPFEPTSSPVMIWQLTR
nr:class I SAM-dependent methyltransferase [uncultured Cohaesibacter sp.]